MTTLKTNHEYVAPRWPQLQQMCSGLAAGDLDRAGHPFCFTLARAS
ncbi:MAG: hypothetical protein ABI360_08030 [Allobranchiibius sp.]